MSTPSNQNQPGRPTGDQPSQPAGAPGADASGSDSGVSPTDPTRTQWVQVVPPASRPPTPPASQPPAGQPPASQSYQSYQPYQSQPGQAANPPPPQRQQTAAPTRTAAAVTPVAPPAASPAATSVTPVAQKTRQRRSRSSFWPGFAVGFLLLAAISCGGVTAALGLNRLSLDDIRGNTGPAWTPMPVTPTAAIVESAPDAAPDAQPVASSTRFTGGQTVRNATNSRVNIRLTPGYLGKEASDVIGQLQVGQSLQIVGDPTVADELTWWRVQADSNGQTVVGWVAEQTASGVQILSATP